MVGCDSVIPSCLFAAVTSLLLMSNYLTHIVPVLCTPYFLASSLAPLRSFIFQTSRLFSVDGLPGLPGPQ